MIRPWALAGFSGTGKTTVGRLLADAAGRRFADLDEVIGHARVLELLLQGEDALRDAEAGALGVLAAGPPGLVVALGGGVLEGDASRVILKERFVLAWLDAPLATCLSRCEASDAPRRPVLAAALARGPGAVERLLATRLRRAAVAGLRVDARPHPADVARILLPLLHAAETEP